MTFQLLHTRFLTATLLVLAFVSAAEETGSVSGKAILADCGTPVSGIVRFSEPIFGIPSKAKTSPIDGSFRGEGLSPGTYRFTFTPDSETRYSLESEIKAEVWPGRETDNLVFRVAEGYAIKGIVLDVEGNPLPGFRISYGTQRRSSSTTSFSDGKFSLERLKLTDAYQITADNGAGVKTTVAVEPGAPGTISELIVVQLSAPLMHLAEKSIKGEVIDTAGNPVSEISVGLRSQEWRSGTTDAEGRFEITVHGAETFRTSVTTSIATSHTGKSHLSFEVLEGQSITTVEDLDEYHLRVVIQPPNLLTVFVTDEAERPVSANVGFLPRSSSDQATVSKQDDKTLIYNLADSVSLIIVGAEGYIARLLERGRDFDQDTKEIHVKLRTGPIPPNEPVFTALTGRPATEEEAALVPFYEEIRYQEESFRRLAEPRDLDAPPEPPPGSRPPHTQDIFVQDVDGQPAKQVHIRPMGDSSPFYLLEHSPIFQDRLESRVLLSNDGNFTVPTNVSLWTPGSGRVLLGRRMSLTSELLSINLQKAGHIRILVLDENGNPAQNVGAIPPGIHHTRQAVYFRRSPKTDATGTLVIPDVPPGVYAYSLVKSCSDGDDRNVELQVYPFMIICHVESGATHEQTVFFGETHADSPEGVLVNLRRQYTVNYLGRHFQDPPRITKSTAKKLGALISDYLDRLPARAVWEEEETIFLAEVIRALNLSSAAPALRALLKRLDTQHDYEHLVAIDMPRFPPAGPNGFACLGLDVGTIVETLASLEGNKATRFFASLAVDDTRPYKIRRDAVIALGIIGTKQSVSAYRKLRDTAFALHDAPQPLSDPTHAEKISEALHMTLYLIPDKIDRPEAPPRTQISVSEDYLEATLNISRRYAGLHVTLRRFDEEWLITGIVDGPR